MIKPGNVYDDCRNVMTAILSAPEIMPEHPAYPGSNVPAYQVMWGERPTRCERGSAIAYGWVSGQRTLREYNCSGVMELSLTVGSISGGMSESERRTLEKYWAGLSEALGMNGLAATFTSRFLLRNAEYGPGWFLSQVGVRSTNTLGASEFGQELDGMKVEHREMVVRWDVDIYAEKPPIKWGSI